MLRKDKEVFQAYLSITMLQTAEGGFMVYRITDISANKKFEAELIKAREAAEEAVQAKSQFLATMSHEIRTPLNGVIGTASLLERTHLNTEQSTYVDTILRSSQSLMVLINDILDFSKIESGKMNLDPVECDIRNEVQSVAELLRPHAETKQLKFIVDIEREVPGSLLLDAMRLKQILLNLLGNAIKFTESGTVQMTCSVISRMRNEVELKFVVKDTGLGISPEKQNLLFQSFSQVHQNSSKKYGGTGLGLAISKDLVELMGGNIKVSSSEGNGSIFEFNIKTLIDDVTVNNEHSTFGQRITEEQLHEFSKLRVAIAEDNRINSDVIFFMLDKLGIKTSRAYNGLEMVDLLRENDYDILFMDVQMPELDGLRATQIIRNELNKFPYIVAITANSSAEDRKLCEAAGMQAFISKPFLYHHLEKVLLEYLVKSPKERI